MSGICGTVRRDGRPARMDELEPMLRAMAARGPEGTGTWADQGVAFGVAKLATTPEARTERLPLTHGPSGCTIVADARLDNREALVPELAPDRRGLGDGELILRAYLRWGDNCLSRLLGDYAFAIWDGRARRLFAARDPMGIRQLHYADCPGRLLAFATDAAAVAAHADIPDDLDEARIADVLADLECTDPRASLFRSVKRLEPGFRLTLEDGQLRTARWFRIETPPRLRLGGDAEYEEALREVLGSAIDARLRSAGRPGLMLSGGLDSASIAALAGPLWAREGHGPLPTFSVVDRQSRQCEESECARISGSLPGLDPHLVDLSEAARDPEYLDLTGQLSDPFDFSMTVPRAAYLAARRAGCNVVLDARSADTVLGPHDHLATLIRRGAWIEALQEARAERRFWDDGIGTATRLFQAAGQGLVPRPLRIARRRLLWAITDRAGRGKSLASEALQRAHPEAERREWHRARTMMFSRTGRAGRAAAIHHDYLHLAAERYDRVAASVGIEARDPFADLRVIRFALSLPPRQLQRRGWPKWILRAAMADILPDRVRWRRGKSHLGPELTALVVDRFTSERKIYTTGQYVNESNGDLLGSKSADSRHCDNRAILLSMVLWLERRFPSQSGR